MFQKIQPIRAMFLLSSLWLNLVWSKAKTPWRFLLLYSVVISWFLCRMLTFPWDPPLFFKAVYRLHCSFSVVNSSSLPLSLVGPIIYFLIFQRQKETEWELWRSGWSHTEKEDEGEGEGGGDDEAGLVLAHWFTVWNLPEASVWVTHLLILHATDLLPNTLGLMHPTTIKCQSQSFDGLLCI